MKKNTSPPKFFLRFFRWFCHQELRDSIEGDLIELYHERYNEAGKTKADRNFIIDVLLLFRPGIINPGRQNYSINHFSMIKSYFKIGLRNILRDKGYSLINIGGLAMGMSVAILIGLWIWDEVSYNDYHKNYDRLVRVMQQQTVDGKVLTQYAIPRPLEYAMRNEYANDFSYLSMSTWTDEHILTVGDRSLSQKGNYVQADFPKMFSLNMVEGVQHGLQDPTSIMLSETTAKALFGTGNALHQVIRIDNTLDVKVTGVYKDLPSNSEFRDISFISSWELYASNQEWMKRSIDRWDNNSFQLFGQLAPQTNFEWIDEKVKFIRAKYSKDNTLKPVIFLHPMRDWHLRSNWENGVKTGGQIQTVWMFGIIGIFVLALACINFVNLTTARSQKRSKEVGIRMTIGSKRAQLIQQFLSESFLVVTIAYIVALALAGLFLPSFNVLADKAIIMQWSNPFFWCIGFAFSLITGLLAGSYPAFFLSSFRPVTVLKSSFKSARLASLPRELLVILQFTVSIALVICTLIIYDQVQYSKNRPTGYERSGVIMIQVKSPDFVGKYETLREALINTGGVSEVAESSSPLTQIWNNGNSFSWPGKNPDLQSSDFGIIAVSPEYGKTVGWHIKEGRDFSRDVKSDSTAIILNEAALKFMGIKDPLGLELIRGIEKFHVIGIVKDMVVESPYHPVRPSIYLVDNALADANWINVKLKPLKTTGESLAAVESVFKQFAPSVPFDYTFADTEYAKKFGSEERVGTLSYVFAGLATLISCLGLIGLASFVAEQHRKEIGVRKVLGASVTQLWKMLSGNFVVLILISCVISVPIAYFLMSNWLLNFEYRTAISWTTILLTIFGAVGLTILTVSYQAISAAMANPVESLKSE